MSLRLTLDGNRPLSAELGALIDSLGHLAGLDGRQTYRLRLAADEIVTNVVVHGYRLGGGPISVVCGTDAATAWVRIEDEAPPFDPRCHDPSARLAAGATAGPIGGFGLFLALRSLDCLDYEYDGHRNRCTLSVYRSR